MKKDKVCEVEAVAEGRGPDTRRAEYECQGVEDLARYTKILLI